MTECNTQAMLFSNVNRKQVVADFDGGSLTSDAGILLMREADKKLGVSDIIDRCIEDIRDLRYCTHEQKELLQQRIYGIAGEYEDLNDHNELRKDPAFQVASEKEVSEDVFLGSAPTLCRLENHVTQKDIQRLAKGSIEMFMDSFDVPPKRLTFDFDPTDDEIHGRQEKSFFHGYYDHYCFLPIYIFCGSKLVLAYLRPSNIDGAKHCRAILKMIVKMVSRRWPGVKITVRGDSGFARPRLMRWCERHGLTYIFGISSNNVLKEKSKHLVQLAERRFKAEKKKQRLFGQFRYAAGSWEVERRIIFKAEHLEKGANTRFLVTNLKGSARRLYDNVYCPRGEMENRIKEHQTGLFGNRTSCHNFVANQLRLFLASAAYTLIEYMRREILAGTELATAQISTIRVKLLKIGARVKTSMRRIVFHLASGYPFKDLFERVLSRLMAIPDKYFSSG